VSTEQPTSIRLLDLEPDAGDFLHDALGGLRGEDKTLPCKYLYDARGSELFERICELPEYYPTRTELGILRENIANITADLEHHCLVVEYGAGSGLKTKILLAELDDPAAYVPIDISREALLGCAEDLRSEFPDLEILPVCADFTQHFQLPQSAIPPQRRVVFFPGSTIGNFTPEHAAQFLKRCAELCGPGGGILLGVDLQKSRETLEAAYDDAEGTTAKFNLNLLLRMNRELGSNFDLDAFHHEARYNSDAGRIEMRLVSDAEQAVALGGERFEFAKGEFILTECSYKYAEADFARMASSAGLEREDSWTDPQSLFSVQLFRVPD